MAVRGFEYAFEDLQVSLLGRVFDVQEVKYNYKKDHKTIRGRKGRAIAMVRGDEAAEGASITILQSDFEAIQRTMPKGKTLVHLEPFDVTVCYAPEGGAITTDILKFCRVTGQEKGFKNGDGNMMVELPLEVGEIEYNA